MDFIRGADVALGTGGIYERLAVTLGAPAWLRAWIEIEREARVIKSYESVVLPGLLQTEAYARALLTSGLLTPEQAQQQVTARMDRQAVLTRDEPPQMVAVVDEHVLRRPVGGREVMRAQLHHLVKISERVHIQIQVVPSTVGAYLGLGGPFVLATLPTTTDVAYLDNQLKGQVVTEAADVMLLRQAWDAIRGDALSVPQSVDLISEVAETWS
jgi:hypothetical protein